MSAQGRSECGAGDDFKNAENEVPSGKFSDSMVGDGRLPPQSGSMVPLLSTS